MTELGNPFVWKNTNGQIDIEFLEFEPERKQDLSWQTTASGDVLLVFEHHLIIRQADIKVALEKLIFRELGPIVID